MDFTDDLLFKTLMLEHEILCDFIIAFAPILQVKISDILIPPNVSYVDRPRVIEILKNADNLDILEVEQQLLKVVPNISVQIVQTDDSVTQLNINIIDFASQKYLMHKTSQQLASSVSESSCLTLNLCIKPMQEDAVTQTLICNRVATQDGWEYSPVSTLNRVVCVDINSQYEEPKLKKWIDFLATGELDLKDEIPAKIYGIYKMLKTDKEWNEMAKEQPTRAEFLIAMGIEQGRELERAQMETNISEAKAKAKAEAKAEIAKMMVDANVDIEIIKHLCGLSATKIESLKS